MKMSQRKIDGTGKRSAADRKIQRDWVFAENSMFNRVDSYTTENLTAFPGGRIEVRHFSWSRPMDSVWETGKRCYLFTDLEEVAALCDITLRHLTRAFRTDTGQTLGYSHSGAFASAFRRATGVRPGEVKMAGGQHQ
jgi:AraC-like DNA-binding protein